MIYIKTLSYIIQTAYCVRRYRIHSIYVYFLCTFSYFLYFFQLFTFTNLLNIVRSNDCPNSGCSFRTSLNSFLARVLIFEYVPERTVRSQLLPCNKLVSPKKSPSFNDIISKPSFKHLTDPLSII